MRRCPNIITDLTVCQVWCLWVWWDVIKSVSWWISTWWEFGGGFFWLSGSIKCWKRTYALMSYHHYCVCLGVTLDFIYVFIYLFAATKSHWQCDFIIMESTPCVTCRSDKFSDSNGLQYWSTHFWTCLWWYVTTSLLVKGECDDVVISEGRMWRRRY